MPRESLTPGLVRPSEGSSNLLAAVCGWFTEVFETLGLKEANARLAFCAGCGRTSAGASASCAMIEKTKSGSRVGIALVGAFATTAGIGEITLKRTGQYFDRLLILRRRFGTIKQT